MASIDIFSDKHRYPDLWQREAHRGGIFARFADTRASTRDRRSEMVKPRQETRIATTTEGPLIALTSLRFILDTIPADFAGL